MKKKHIALASVLLIAVAAICYFAFGGSSSAYERIIPANSDFVMCVNMTEFAEKSGLSGETMKKKVDALLALAPEELSKEFGKYFENPEELGVRFDKPMYIWMTSEDKAIGVSVAIHDAGKLQAALRQFSEKAGVALGFEEEFGLTWIKSAIVGRQAAIGFNDDFLVARIGKNDRDIVRKWMEQPSDEQYFQTDRAKRLTKTAGQWKMDAQMSAAALERMGMQREGEQLRDEVGDCEYGSVWGLNAGDGFMEYNVEVYTNDESVNKLMEDMAGCGKIKGTYNELTPQDYLFWLGMNMNAKEAFEAFRQTPFYKALEKFQKDNNLDLEKLLSGVNGDLALYVSTMEDMRSEPEVTVRAEVTDTQFIDNLVAEMTRVNPELCKIVRKTSGSNYSVMTCRSKFNMESMSYDSEYVEGGIAFGQNDGTAYFTTKKDNLGTSVKSTALKDYTDEMASCALFGVVNMQEIVSLLDDDCARHPHDRTLLMTKNLLNQIRDIKLTMREGGKFNVRCNFKDEETKVIDLIVTFGVGSFLL
mgnify:FL=1